MRKGLANQYHSCDKSPTLGLAVHYFTWYLLSSTFYSYHFVFRKPKIPRSAPAMFRPPGTGSMAYESATIITSNMAGKKHTAVLYRENYGRD